jgi:hypothetical protein
MTLLGKSTSSTRRTEPLLPPISAKLGLSKSTHPPVTTQTQRTAAKVLASSGLTPEANRISTTRFDGVRPQLHHGVIPSGSEEWLRCTSCEGMPLSRQGRVQQPLAWVCFATMLTCGVGRFRSPHHCYAGLHSSCSDPTMHPIKPLRHPSYSLTGTLNPGSLLT